LGSRHDFPSVTTSSHVTTTRLKPDELLVVSGLCLPTVSSFENVGACRFSPARMSPGGQGKIRPGNFVNLKMTWRGRCVSIGRSQTLGSTPIQLHRFPEVVEDDFSEFRGVDDRDPTGPAEEPVGKLIQTIDGEAQGDAAVAVTFDGLGGVPDGLRDEVGGIPCELDHDLVGLGTAIHTPRISEVGFEIKVVRHHRGGIRRTKRLKPRHPVGSGLVRMVRAGYEIPGLTDQAEAIGMQLQP